MSAGALSLELGEIALKKTFVSIFLKPDKETPRIPWILNTYIIKTPFTLGLFCSISTW